MKTSILISTHNRATHLRETLASLGRVYVPQGMTAEAILIDNRSTDDTAAIIRAAELANVRVRYLYEPRPGKSHALNRAIAETEAEVLLFTDDDVRFPADWLAGITKPIAEGVSHAVAGGVCTAPHLIRPDVEDFCYELLADTRRFDPKNPTQLVGANMAIAREVFAKVPAFDPELGPAGLGSGEEAILTKQMLKAGFRVSTAFELQVEHHFEENRLRRASFVQLAEKTGRSVAYVVYHWNHYPISRIPARLLRAQALYLRWRQTNRREIAREYGIARAEMDLLIEIAKYRQLRIETARPRNYEKHGLVKINGVR